MQGGRGSPGDASPDGAALALAASLSSVTGRRQNPATPHLAAPAKSADRIVPVLRGRQQENPVLTIYAIPASLYCAKLRILLRFKGLEWQETPPPGGYGSQTYRALVPAGNLPALRDGDLLLADSEVIAEYLEECRPYPSALPGPPAQRAQSRARSRFHDTRLEPRVRAAFAYLPGRTPITGAVAMQLSADIDERLQQLATLLEGMPGAGECLTLGECGFAVTFTWIDALAPLLGLTIDWPAPVAAYRERFESLDAIAAELTGYRATLGSFLAG